MLAKRFFHVSAGVLCLALAYHFGATSATAQSPGLVGFATDAGGNYYAMAANGDVYFRRGPFNGDPQPMQGPTLYVGSITGGPTPTSGATWGQVKARYR